MIFDILKKSKENKKFIGIYLYNDDGFWSGYVKDFTEDFIILQHFTKYGKPDGLIVEQIENIESIDFDDDYSQAMEFLIENANAIEKETEIDIKIEHPDIWQKEVLEEEIGRKDRMVRIQVNDDSYFGGFVVWCDEDHLILNVIDKQGQDEGKTIYKIEDINSIRINDLASRKKLLLYNWRKANA